MVRVVTKTSMVKEDRENRSQKWPCAFIFLGIPAKKVRNGSFGDDLGPNRGLSLIDAKTLLLMEFASAIWRISRASRACKGSGLQSGELSLHDLMVHCSLIGRALEVWILLEWRLLPWCS